jgi:hypothetical protein
MKENSDDFNTSASDDADRGPGDTQGPVKAIRGHCLWCCNGSALEVRHCPATSCPVWPYRFGRNPTTAMIAELGGRPIYPLEDATTAAEFHEKGGTALKAIRRRCIDCSGNSKSRVSDCSARTCPLHPFRLGTNPNRAMSPEQRKIAAARLKANIQRGNGDAD